MFQLILGSIALVLVILGCAEPEFDDALNETKVTASDYRTAIVIPADAPNKYSFKVSSTAEFKEVVEARVSTIGATSVQHHIADTTNVNELTFHSLAGGNTYRAELVTSSGSVVALLNFETPLDLVIDQPTQLDSIRLPDRVGRIFFEDQGFLFSDGLPVTLQANEIVGSDARIFAFTPDSRTEPRGRKASDFNITIGKITGHLSISNTGEKGAHGPEGSKGDTGGPGSEGPMIGYKWEVNGVSVGPFCSYAGDTEFGDGTPGGPSEDEWSTKHPGRGNKGAKGKVGKVGGTGLKGGESGALSLTIPPEYLPLVSLDVRGGSGGDGGTGGDGGDGGPGGSGGHIFGNGPCRPSPPGPPGDQGDRGPTGPSGESGDRGTIIINGVRINEEQAP